MNFKWLGLFLVIFPLFFIFSPPTYAFYWSTGVSWSSASSSVGCDSLGPEGRLLLETYCQGHFGIGLTSHTRRFCMENSDDGSHSWRVEDGCGCNRVCTSCPTFGDNCNYSYCLPGWTGDLSPCQITPTPTHTPTPTPTSTPTPTPTLIPTPTPTCAPVCTPLCGQADGCGGTCLNTDGAAPSETATIVYPAGTVGNPTAVGTSVAFQWNRVVSSLADYYGIWVWDSSNIRVKNVDWMQGGLATVSYTMDISDLSGGQIYHWAVRAVNGTPCTTPSNGPWSTNGYFRLNAIPTFGSLVIKNAAGTVIGAEN